MNIELITKEDIKLLVEEISSVKELLNSGNSNFESGKWKRSKEVKKILGISDQTLQYYRDNGIISHSLLGKTYFYDINSVYERLEQNKTQT